MAIITMRIPTLDRAFASAYAAAQAPVKAFNRSFVETYGAVVRVPVKAIGNPAVAICGAVGKSLRGLPPYGMQKIHLPTLNTPKETPQ